MSSNHENLSFFSNKSYAIFMSKLRIILVNKQKFGKLMRKHRNVCSNFTFTREMYISSISNKFQLNIKDVTSKIK